MSSSLDGWRTVVIALLGLVGASAIADDTSPDDDQYRKILHEAMIRSAGDLEVLVREHEYPPGWAAPTHYHDGNLFIYVVSGQFEIRTNDSGTVLYGPGQAMQMAAGTVMDARNASDEAPLKLVIFQVGDPGHPFLVPTR
jgi:quercetin dioxygenase-like cupin family protein